jgi:hypothetical protein
MFTCVLGGGGGAEVQFFGSGAEEKEQMMIMWCETTNHASFILMCKFVSRFMVFC